MSKDDRRLEGAAAFVSVSCGMDRANRSQPRTSSGGESRGECGETALNPAHRLEHAMCINHQYSHALVLLYVYISGYWSVLRPLPQRGDRGAGN